MPESCRRSMTSDHDEPSAYAPCTASPVAPRRNQGPDRPGSRGPFGASCCCGRERNHTDQTRSGDEPRTNRRLGDTTRLARRRRASITYHRSCTQPLATVSRALSSSTRRTSPNRSRLFRRTPACVLDSRRHAATFGEPYPHEEAAFRLRSCTDVAGIFRSLPLPSRPRLCLTLSRIAPRRSAVVTASTRCQFQPPAHTLATR